MEKIIILILIINTHSDFYFLIFSNEQMNQNQAQEHFEKEYYRDEDEDYIDQEGMYTAFEIIRESR